MYLFSQGNTTRGRKEAIEAQLDKLLGAGCTGSDYPWMEASALEGIQNVVVMVSSMLNGKFESCT